MLLLRSNGTLLHMKDCIITFVKLIISKKHNFILYNALTNRDSPNFPLPSNPLPQIVTSNPRLQPDTHFAVDMFPYKTTELFQELGFYSQLPKKPGNTPLSGTYLSFLDIKTTVSQNIFYRKAFKNGIDALFFTRWFAKICPTSHQFVETYQWITASPLYVFGTVNF